jgi:RNA polymerase-binding transcription factor DksA
VDTAKLPENRISNEDLVFLIDIYKNSAKLLESNSHSLVSALEELQYRRACDSTLAESVSELFAQELILKKQEQERAKMLKVWPARDSIAICAFCGDDASFRASDQTPCCENCISSYKPKA